MKNLLKYSMMFLAVIMGTMTIASCGGEDEDMNQQPPKTNNGNTNQGNGTDVSNDASNGNQEDEADVNREDSNGNHENDVNYGSHEYVDLGLSVKWATCNVGANKPEEYGDYFAWGETVGYNTNQKRFDWSTYKWCNGSYNTLTKYCTGSSYSKVDNKTVLDKEDDAAAVNWGGSWRMPTVAEMEELRHPANCTCTWTTINGVNGYKVTSRKNGNSIFIPAAGYRQDLVISIGSHIGIGSYGSYWSSSLDKREDVSYLARHLRLDSNNIVGDEWEDRCEGLSVRAVCP